MPNNVIDVDEARFQSDVLEASKRIPVVVDFWAEWCGPCKQLSPTLEKVAEEGAGAFLLAKVDVDRNPRLSQSFKVQSIPTVIAFKDGRQVSQFTGAVPEASVRQFIAALMPPPVDPVVSAVEEMIDAGDVEGAEARLQEILASQPANLDAALLLASLLIDRGATEEALELLARQSQTTEVKKMAAAARLVTSGDVDLTNPEAALPLLLERVGMSGDDREKARLAMIDIFEVLGPEHQLTTEYRRKLASALF
jgi:putative thioredoxin